MRILLVEDEVDLAQALASALRQNQAVVDVAGSLREAEDAALSAQHDVIVLDRGLPDGDGLSLVAFLRQNSIAAAVLVLTAMLDNVRRIVEAAGGGTQDIVKLTVWMKDRSQRPALNAPWLEMFPDAASRPARHAIVAPELDMGKLIECSFTAWIA